MEDWQISPKPKENPAGTAAFRIKASEGLWASTHHIGSIVFSGMVACCGEALHHARPDDAPPYFVILIVGHVAVSFALALEETSAPPLWLTLLATMAIACVLTFALLPPVKGAIIALQWIFWMHGFDAYETDEPTETRPQTLHAAAAARGPALPAASLLDRSIDAAQCADADDRRPSVPISLISAEG